MALTPTQIDKIHDEAMGFTDKAMSYQKRGHFKAARRHFEAALELESRAAWETSKLPGFHQSAMILSTSAAAIARSIMSVNLAENTKNQPPPQPESEE